MDNTIGQLRPWNTSHYAISTVTMTEQVAKSEREMAVNRATAWISASVLYPTNLLNSARMHWSAVLSLLCLVVAAIAASPAVSPSLQRILDRAHQAPLYTYPTSLTQGIIPKYIHSHNDYWRDVPFYSALSVGAVSVEVDVWLYNGTLHVGHEQGALTRERTFQSLYIDPILDTLQRQNPNSSFLTAPTYNGVFDTNGRQTLYLFVDLKTDGPTTWPYVVRALEPL